MHICFLSLTHLALNHTTKQAGSFGPHIVPHCLALALTLKVDNDLLVTSSEVSSRECMS